MSRLHGRTGYREARLINAVHVIPEALEKKDWPIFNIDDIF